MLMNKRFVMSLIMGGSLALGSSVGTSWADFLDIGEALQKKGEQGAVRLGENLINSTEKKVSKEADNAINGPSTPQTPPQSQANQGTTSSKPTDPGRSNQVNAQEQTKGR